MNYLTEALEILNQIKEEASKEVQELSDNQKLLDNIVDEYHGNGLSKQQYKNLLAGASGKCPTCGGSLLRGECKYCGNSYHANGSQQGMDWLTKGAIEYIGKTNPEFTKMNIQDQAQFIIDNLGENSSFGGADIKAVAGTIALAMGEK